MKKYIKYILIVLFIIILGILFVVNIKKNDGSKSIEKEEYILTKDEALSIIKTKFDYVESFLTIFGYPCGDSEIDTSIQKDGMPYFRSKDFHSYKELNNELLKYMSQEVISEKIINKDEIYMEKNNSLYCYLQGGGDVTIYDPTKTEYNIEKITSNKIDVKITSYSINASGTNPEYDVIRNANVVLTKNKNNWIVSKHELIK